MDLKIDEIVSDKVFGKSNTEIETYQSIEAENFLQEFEVGGINNLEVPNQTEMNDPRVQAIFKRSRHNSLSVLISSQVFQELPKRTIRANGNFYHIFKSDKFRDVQNLYPLSRQSTCEYDT